jgi:hypothetical protein
MSVRKPASSALSFEHLVTSIGRAHASRAVNSSLTLCNWLIGLYIAEYEQQGSDRAQYGDTLIERLSDRLIVAGVSRAEARELRRYRQFYLTYPQIRESLPPEFATTLLAQTGFTGNRESATPELGVTAGDVLSRLSFSHIAELLACNDATKRAFYELECIRGNRRRGGASLPLSRLRAHARERSIEGSDGPGHRRARRNCRRPGLHLLGPRTVPLVRRSTGDRPRLVKSSESHESKSSDGLLRKSIFAPAVYERSHWPNCFWLAAAVGDSPFGCSPLPDCGNQ